MNVEILDFKEIENRTWYLCKGNLYEYLKNLKSDFYDYAIQRKIVKNQYLDALYQTIKTGEPIPTITLTYNKEKLDEISLPNAQIDLAKSEILDGLQRSFRLWAYLKIAEEYKEHTNSNYRDFARHIKSKNPLFFDSGVISTKLLRTIMEDGEINQIENVFKQYKVYFTIWAGLNENQVIKKMLILNAGQKSVSKTHQFELLFLHFYQSISESNPKIKLYREKDSEANNIKRGNREIGEFMFSSVIVALQSFVEEKPLRVSTENLIDNHLNNTDTETDTSIYDYIFNLDFINIFLDKLLELDKTIFTRESKEGKEWLSKDTTLSGVFAALGKTINISSIKSEDELKTKSNKNINLLIEIIQEKGLALEEFTSEYNVLSSRSVNIGSFIRKVVMEYIVQLLEEENPSWKSVFEKIKKT